MKHLRISRSEKHGILRGERAVKAGLTVSQPEAMKIMARWLEVPGNTSPHAAQSNDGNRDQPRKP